LRAFVSSGYWSYSEETKIGTDEFPYEIYTRSMKFSYSNIVNLYKKKDIIALIQDLQKD